MSVFLIRNLKVCFFQLIYMSSVLGSTILSPTGSIKFDVDMNNSHEMELNNIGLGVGKTPSANLDVSGNAFVSNSITIGVGHSHSNININGTLSMIPFSSNVDVSLDKYSLNIIDSSISDIEVTLPGHQDRLGQIFSVKKKYIENCISVQSSGNIDLDYEGIELGEDKKGSVTLFASDDGWLIMSSHEKFRKLISTDNLLAHWKLDDENGDIANDSSGAGLHLTISGGNNWLEDAVRKGGHGFNGSNYSQSIGGAITGASGVMSFAFWFKGGTNNGFVFSNQGSHFCRYLTASSGSLRFVFDGSTGNGSTVAGSNLGDGDWHHVVVTHDGSNHNIYIDGVFVTSGSDSLSAAALGRPFALGSQYNGVTRSATQFDDVRIYGRILSLVEIEYLYYHRISD